jgi:diguanylate cyclase (GGDEF)-like protein
LLARWSPAGNTADGAPSLADRMLNIAPGRETISHGSKRIGEVRVIGDTGIMANYLLTGALISLCCLGITVIASRLLMRRMEEDVVGPLAQIASVAHTVRRKRAFGLRVPQSAIAEIDTFSTDFNALLAELQGWHASLTEEKDQLAHQATHDSLTALGNRALFEHRLAEMVAETVRSGAPFGLLYLDADYFKQVNDTHGHLSGDMLLVGIAGRIRACIRQHDQAFRLGGDEFAVILTPAVDQARLDAVIRRIERAMDEPVALPSGGAVRPSLSIGAAIYPDDGISPQDLLRRADEAMYQHKLRKRGDFYSPESHA